MTKEETKIAIVKRLLAAVSELEYVLENVRDTDEAHLKSLHDSSISIYASAHALSTSARTAVHDKRSKALST